MHEAYEDFGAQACQHALNIAEKFFARSEVEKERLETSGAK
jgi:hypothetical protein